MRNTTHFCNSVSHKKKNAFAGILIIALLWWVPLSLSAAVNVGRGMSGLTGLKHFGGVAAGPMFPCTCTWPLGYVLFIGPPSPAVVVFAPGDSILYSHYLPVPGAWMLGQDYRYKCKFWAGKKCLTFPTRGHIYHVGTSIPGASFAP